MSQRWYHVIISTYGGWLHGDPRGFRTRHHRAHVEGDYNIRRRRKDTPHRRREARN
jgi:hypothetical protein